MNRPPIISSAALRLSDLPPVGTSWQKVSMFALTFDPRELEGYGGKVEDPSDAAKMRKIAELRAQLYAEQRRWNHYGRPPDSVAFESLKRVLELLREKLVDT